MHFRTALPLSLLALSGCFVEGPHSRDQHRTVDQIRQEHRWASNQIGRRTSADELARVRAGESQPNRTARLRLVRLIDALDRITWIREATPRGLWASVEDHPDLDELVFRFDRAGKLRAADLAEADELAEALAASPAPGALSFVELRKALTALRASEAAEERIAASLGTLQKKEPALRSIISRFPPLPPASPRPFLGATASYLRYHPAEQAELDKLPVDAAADVRRIRAMVDDQGPAEAGQQQPLHPQAGPVAPLNGPAGVRDRADREHAEADAEAAAHPMASAGSLPPGVASGGPPTATGAPTAGPATRGGGATHELQGDARQMLTNRGLPRSMGTRDGLLALRYEEPRPCAAGSCIMLIDYLFNSAGTLVREETAGPAPKAAGAAAPAPMVSEPPAPRAAQPTTPPAPRADEPINDGPPSSDGEPAAPAKAPPAPRDDEFKGDD